MKQKSALKTVSTAAYAILSVLLCVFFMYMYFGEHNAVYTARDASAYRTVEGYTIREIEDSAAPAGIRKEYEWTLGDVDVDESCLLFYVVHHYAEVLLDGEAVYILTQGENNRIGGSPSSNWVVVPLSTSDSGKTVRVIVTPAFRSVAEREINFIIGSRFAVLAARFRADFFQILLSMLCIVIGIFLMAVQTYFVIRGKVTSWDLLYLGNFALIIGIWRITDTRSSPVLFSNNTMALGYITLGMLLVIGVPLLLFLQEQYAGRGRAVLQTAALLNCIAALAALLCQVLGIAELREMLPLSHAALIVDVVSMLAVALYSRRNIARKKSLKIFILLLSAGALLDVIYFYRHSSSSGLMFTIIALLVYIVTRFVETIMNVNKKAYLDAHTGLPNKRRWDELMKDTTPVSQPTGIIVIDMNGLKHINDTMGHEAGDKMLGSFADILRETNPHSHAVCRWGGDEFVILIPNADHAKMQSCIDAIRTAVDAYNMSGEKPEISFSAGYALSSDYPDIRLQALFAKADDAMYHDKQQWHAAHPGIR